VDSKTPLVEFYDLRYGHTPDGQFITRYDFYTMIEDYRSFAGLNLNGGVPNWSIDGDTMHMVRGWLNSFEISS
jgi:hypothetical protein